MGTEYTEASFVSKLFDYPMVMKVVRGSKGKGVVLVNNEKELDKPDQYEYRRANRRSDYYSGMHQSILGSRSADDPGQREVCQIIYPSERKELDLLAKGGHIVDYTPPAAVIEAAEQVAQLLKINMGSVDFLFGENDTFYLCEANAMPGVAFDIEVMFADLMKQVKDRPGTALEKTIARRGQNMLGWLLVNHETLAEPSIQTIIALIEKMGVNIRTVDVSEVQVMQNRVTASIVLSVVKR